MLVSLFHSKPDICLYFSLFKQKCSQVTMEYHVSKGFSDIFDFVQKEHFVEGMCTLGFCVTGAGGS